MSLDKRRTVTSVYYSKRILAAKKIEVKNPGILEVPEGRSVSSLGINHFKKLIEKKGYAPIIRALTNLQVWNKNENPKLSKWAEDMSERLRKVFRPELVD